MPKRKGWTDNDYQNAVRQYLKRFYDRLDKQEASQFRYLAKKWKVIQSELKDLITELSKVEVKTLDQLYRLGVWQTFLNQSEQQIKFYSFVVDLRVSEMQDVAIRAGLALNENIAYIFDASFESGIGENAVRAMIGMSSEGAPLYDLLMKSYPQTVEDIADQLIKSTALGINPRVTARLLTDKLDGNFKRSLRIARTEQMNAYREASRLQMEANGLDKWEWLAEDDACDYCLEQNGKQFSTEKVMQTHPNCRCAMLPVVNVGGG